MCYRLEAPTSHRVEVGTLQRPVPLYVTHQAGNQPRRKSCARMSFSPHPLALAYRGRTPSFCKYPREDETLGRQWLHGHGCRDCPIRAMRLEASVVGCVWDGMGCTMWLAEGRPEPRPHTRLDGRACNDENVRSRLLVCATRALHGSLSPVALWSAWLRCRRSSTGP